MRACVIGAGAWGTALADLLARNGHETRLWAREVDVVHGIRATGENRRFLAGVSLNPALEATNDLKAAMENAEIVTWATPSQVLRDVVRRSADAAARATIHVVASKGIEHGTYAIMTDVLGEELPTRSVVALSGPSFAAEVAAGQPTAIVAASADERAARSVQTAFSSRAFRVYTHDDVVGVELGGSLKNVMAIATGIVEGLGLGYNSRAALITRGLAEVSRLGVALGAQPATFAGLAGIGDLVLTCTGGLSRNRAVGIEVGQGRGLADIMEGRDTVAEGVSTAQSAFELASRERVEMPIVAAVYKILFEGRPAAEAIGELMSRELRSEQD